MNAEIPANAVSVYGPNDAMDDFPVLKAFQQYVDAEQAKARKRILMLCSFFGFLMLVVVSVFVLLLLSVSSRNQALNDRLVEYAMRDRDRPSGSAVVVQPPQDTAAIMALNAKLEEMQKRLAERQTAAEKSVKAPKGPTREELEIKRLKALLAAEQEKNSAERKRIAAELERKRQAELEAYRRKHYPDLYEEPAEDELEDEEEPVRPNRKPIHEKQRLPRRRDNAETILKNIEAIRYFADEEESSPSTPEPVKKVAQPPAVPVPPPSSAKGAYSIPVEIKGVSSEWGIPNE